MIAKIPKTLDTGCISKKKASDHKGVTRYKTDMHQYIQKRGIKP